MVDRPLGSRHPRRPDLIEPLNYGGDLRGTLGDDGEPIDAYVLGIAAPVVDARSVAVAVIGRKDDDEDKPVVAVDGHSNTIDEIRALVAVQVRFFRSRIETAMGGTAAMAPNAMEDSARDARCC